MTLQRILALVGAGAALTGCALLPGAEPSLTVTSTVYVAPAPDTVSPGTIVISPPSTASAATATASPDATSPDTTAPPAPRTVTILGSGDVLLHPPLWQQAQRDAAISGAGADYDFDPMFASIADEVGAADIAICQLETPVGAPEGPFSGWPRFVVPPQVLTTLATIGYDSCTTASNHTLDDGPEGVARTLGALDAVGLAHTGSARSAAEAATPLLLTTDDGVVVGQLAYTFGFNGLARPAGQEWLANLLDVDEILGAAADLRASGADIVVLSLHWGIEYDHDASPTQREQAARLLGSGDIDLILGAHAHVVQPAEQIDGRWVFYGMGNQVARHADPVAASREGIMPIVTFTETAPDRFRATEMRVVPTWMELDPEARLIDLGAALAGDPLPGQVRARYLGTADRIGAYVSGTD